MWGLESVADSHDQQGLLATRSPGGDAGEQRIMSLAAFVLSPRDRSSDVNLAGPWPCTKYALPALRARGGGSVVNIGSTASVAFPDLAAQVASKGRPGAAPQGRWRSTWHLSAFGSIVFARPHQHPLGDRFIGAQPDPDAFHRAFAAQHPVGRLGEPNDIAAVTIFLLSPYSAFITGALVPVDGGYTAR